MSKKNKYVYYKWCLWAYRGISGCFYPLSKYANIETTQHGKQPIPKNEYPLRGYHEFKLVTTNED